MPAPAEPSDLLFDDLAEAYLAFSQRTHTASTHRTRRSLVEGKLLPFFRGRRLAEIGVRDIEALMAEHSRLSGATRNRILSALSAVLHYARRLGYVAQNVAASLPHAPEDMLALPLVPLADQARLLAALPPGRRLLFLAALDTGARLGELLALAWRDVDWEAGALLIRRSKSRRPRLVRASKRLLRALREAAGKQVQAQGAIFGAAIDRGGDLRWAWRRSYRLAAAEVGQPALRIHDLRHLAAINLVRAGVDLPTVQAHLGHLHLISTLRYAAYADETASARAARALDRIHDEADGSEAT